MITLRLPLHVKLISPNQRMHWGDLAKHKAALKQDVALQIRSLMAQQHLPRATGPTHLSLTVIRGKGGGKTMDWDNLTAALKAAIDGLVDSGLIIDDSPKYLYGLTVRQIRVDSDVPLVLEVSVDNGDYSNQLARSL